MLLGATFQAGNGLNQSQLISPDRRSNHTRFEREDQWRLRNKQQLGMIRVQLNEKYTQVNVMKAQKEQIEKKLNNVVGRAKTMRPEEV